MAPLRSDGQSSKQGQTKSRNHRPHSEKEFSGTPGVQKIKASLRQTRRLLARDILSADVRVETERRLKALEADLCNAESSRKERALAVRYHKIKFFERQKVVRKIKQVTKRLSTSKSSEKQHLEDELHDLRVDLNYILHYPKMKKYISLFPPEVIPGPSESETTKTDPMREEIRTWIRDCMERKDLSSEPELHLEIGRSKLEYKTVTEPIQGDEIQRKDPKSAQNLIPYDGIEQDAFFGDDDDGDSSS